jgi:carboxyl-terminal processing protease
MAAFSGRRFQSCFRATAAAAVAVACVALAWSRPGGSADAAHPLDRILRARLQVLLKGTVEEIDRNYYDPAFKGKDLKALAAQAHDRIEQATSYDQALAAIADVANQLDDTHTRFFPPWLTAQVRYGWGWQLVGEAAFVTSVTPGSDAERQGVRPGDRVLAINGFPATRETREALAYIFYSLRPQPGLHVELLGVQGQHRELELAATYRRRSPVLDLTLLSGDSWAQLDSIRDKDMARSRPQSIEVGQDVLLVHLPAFGQPTRALPYFSKLEGKSVLVLDLRGNGGGQLDTLAALYGLLTPRPVPLADLRGRVGAGTVMSEGSGAHAFQGRVFVLVDSASASASEMLARTVQLQERGTVIGDRTAGAVMAGKTYDVLAGGGENVIRAQAYVTVADVVMPDGGRLEKRGVLPDFEVMPTADDLATGRDPALALALKYAGHETDPAAAWKLLHAAREARGDEDD